MIVSMGANPVLSRKTSRRGVNRKAEGHVHLSKQQLYRRLCVVTK